MVRKRNMLRVHIPIMQYCIVGRQECFATIRTHMTMFYNTCQYLSYARHANAQLMENTGAALVIVEHDLVGQRDEAACKSICAFPGIYMPRRSLTLAIPL